MQIVEQATPITNSGSSEIYKEHQKDSKELTQSSSPTTPQIPGVSQLLPSLYLCGASVVSPTVISQLGIDFVINVAPELPNTPLSNTSNTLYLRIDIFDRSDADISKHFDEVADMIEEVRQNGGKTLVHCVAGVSRSASLCLAYLMKYCNMNLKDAFMHVRNVRPHVRPNSGFFQQLRSYDELRFGSLSVNMIFLECLQKEIPEVYVPEYRSMEEYYQKQRNSRRGFAKPLST